MNELVELNEYTALAVFADKEKLEPYINQVRQKVADFEHDVSTSAGRKRTAALAAKIAKLKVKLDSLGKELVADWKSKSKIVDSSRKHLREELDELKIIARKPLTEWEDEQKAIEAEELKVEELAQLKIEFEHDHEMGVLLDNEFNRKKADEFLLKEKNRLEYEARLKTEAVEAEKKASADREAQAKQAVIDATEAKKLALEREKLAEERATREREENVTREQLAAHLAEKNKQIAIENAKQFQIQKQQQEVEEKRLADEERANNKAIQAKVNNSILAVFISAGLSSEDAKRVISLIVKNKVPNVKITY